MKNRTPRKTSFQKCSKPEANLKQLPPFPKIKFNLTKDNLSCFIGLQHSKKKIFRKGSRSICQKRKSVPKRKMSEKKGANKKEEERGRRREERSPDILKEFPNTIISCIEKNGVMCPWNDENQTTNLRDLVNDIENEKIWTAFSDTNDKSYVSTVDQHYPIVSYYQTQRNQQLQAKPLIKENVYTINMQNIGNDPRTTIMIRNIPNKYTVAQLAQQIDEQFANTYDFLYLPCDFYNQCNVGYGFINFVDPLYLTSFYLAFQQKMWKKYKSQKICSLAYARLQGLPQLIDHFANSKVLNQKEKKYRPIIKYEQLQEIVSSQQQRT